MQTLLYSRSCLKDYRWIYLTDLCEKEKNNYLDDYRDFENKRDFHLKTPHLYVRFDTRSISIYKFIDTNQVDSCNRHIYALSGFVFSGMEYVFAKKLLEYVVSYFFCNQDQFFTTLEQVSDAVTERALSVEFNVNAIMAECEKNNDIKMGARFVRNFSKENPQTSFFMTEEQIKPIITNKEANLQKGSSTSKTPTSLAAKDTKDMNDPSKNQSAEGNAQNQGTTYVYDEQGKLMVNGEAVSPQTSPVAVFKNYIGGFFNRNKPKNG